MSSPPETGAANAPNREQNKPSSPTQEGPAQHVQSEFQNWLQDEDDSLTTIVKDSDSITPEDAEDVSNVEEHFLDMSKSQDPVNNQSSGQDGDSHKPDPSAKPPKGTKLGERDMRKVRQLGFQKALPKALRKGKAAHKSFATKRNSQKETFEMTDQEFAELFTTDVLDSLQKAGSNTDSPSFKSKNKAKALSLLGKETGHTDDKRKIDMATKKFNHTPRIKDGKSCLWGVKGIKEEGLKNHQIVAVGRMRELEKSGSHKGGLLCDAMGLGKTWEMMANILDDHGAGRIQGPTLIVATLSLVEHWRYHFREYCDANVTGPVLVFRSDKELEPEILANHGVVITTYHQVQSSYPNLDLVDLSNSGKRPTAEDKARFDQQLGPLHRVNWHRIVLDEAHLIKNHDKKTSIAVRSLQGNFRWIISGTPLQNCVEELYSYFNFIKVPHSGTFEEWCRKYWSGSVKTKTTLMMMLSCILIRRDFSDTLFGQPIVPMPECKSGDVIVHGHEAEKKIYDAIVKFWLLRINEFTSPKDSNKQWNCVFTLFMLLRKLASHPMTLCKDWKDQIGPTLLNDLREIARRQDMPTHPSVKIIHLILMMENRVMIPTAELIHPEEVTGQWNSAQRIELIEAYRKRMMGFYEDGLNAMTKLKTSTGLAAPNKARMAWINRQNLVKCPSCGFPPHRAFVTNCQHVYCEDCFYELPEEEGDQGIERRYCSKCEITIQAFAPCGPLDLGLSSLFAAPVPYSENKRKPGEMSKPGGSKRKVTEAKEILLDIYDETEVKNETISEKDPEDPPDVDWLPLIGSQMPGAKLDKVRELIKQWIEEDKTVKIVIYVQFITTLKLLEDMCERAHWGCTAIHGGSSQTQRAENIKQFRDKPGINILICTLTTGGTGIDLSVANKSILVDLWWNEAIENQAASRNLRIGQKRPVQFVRIVLKKSLDTWILGIQKRKIESIKEVMGRSIHKKREWARELLEYFGTVVINESSDGPLMRIVPHPDSSDDEESSSKGTNTEHVNGEVLAMEA